MNPTLAEWLAGKDILITGATGFMGRVLVEKLLRSCNDVNRLYLVIRTRKEQDPNLRMEEYKKDVLFGPLLDLYPEAFDKVTVIPGDMSKSECGISREHQQILKESVSVVFNTAASVRFDDDLCKAVRLNTKGTYELLKLAEQFKKLEVFEHVSTTYCNFHLKRTVEEKVYPSHLNWKDVVDLVDQEEDTLNILQHKLQGTQINTYVLTKSLAENIVAEASERIPCVIVRPSVVVPALKEPLVGWINNLNGLMGIVAGSSKGVLRVLFCKPDAVVAFVPVDVAISGLLVGAWSKRFLDDGQLQVFNEAYGDKIPITNERIVNLGGEINDDTPMENYMWYPCTTLTSNWIFFKFLFFVLQLIPAMIIDSILFLVGKKPILMKINRRIYKANIAVSEFILSENRFSNTKFRNIFDKLSPVDQEAFVVSEEGANFEERRYMQDSLLGMKKYFFHEKEEDLPRYRVINRRLYYIHVTTKVLFWSFVAYEFATSALRWFSLFT